MTQTQPTTGPVVPAEPGPALIAARAAAAPSSPGDRRTSTHRGHRTRRTRRWPHRLLVAAWWLVLGSGLLLLGVGARDAGPDWLGGVGALTVATAYTWALAARTGGRPVVFSALTIVAGGGALVWDRDDLRTGAAVLTAAIAAVLAVMATVPGRRFVSGVREALIAALIAIVGSCAAVGFEPVADFARFQWAVMAVSLIACFCVVYRLGAGLHGLGKRGVFVVVSGCVMLAVMLLYAELIRRYGSPGLVEWISDSLDWAQDNLAAYPRPIQALLGIPALLWGTHMRARRRQGWWLCAFGVAFTAPLACTLVNPDLPLRQGLASLGYSLLVGVVIGWVLIRIDLFLTGSPASGGSAGKRSGGKRVAGRAASADGEDRTAVAREPGRTRALLL